ncbi:MAG: O-antigen ligase family protein [Patescibacteria group bacterium]
MQLVNKNSYTILFGISAIIAVTLLGWSSRAVWGLAIIEIIILSVFLLTISRTKSEKVKLPITLSAFIFFLVLSTVFSVYKYNSILDLVMYTLFIVAFWLVAKFIRNGNQIKIIITVLSSVALISAISGIVNFFQLRDISLGVASFFGWRNIFAGFILLTLPITLTQFLVEKGKSKNIFFGVATILLTVNLYFTFSQASWIAMAFVLLMLIWFLRKLPAKQLIIRLSVVILISVILVTALLQLHAPLSSESIQDANVIQSVAVGNRIDYWRTSLEMFTNYPWAGVGIGNFETIYTHYQQNVWSFSVSPHNSLLLFLTELGVFGLIAFLAFLFAVARKAKILLKNYRPDDKSIYYYAVGIFGGIVASFGHSLTDVDWEVPSLLLLWFIEAGLIYALANTSFGKDIEPSEDRKGNVKTQILFFISSLVFGYLIIVPTITDLWNKKVDIAQNEFGDNINSIAMLKKAIAINPINADLYKNLAESYQISLLDHRGIREENQYNIIKYAREAVRLDPLSAKRHEALGYALNFVSSGEDEEIMEAEIELQKAMVYDPNTIYQYQLLGFILQRQKKYNQAIEILDVALKLYNDETVIKMHADQNQLLGQIESIRKLRETIVTQQVVE